MLNIAKGLIRKKFVQAVISVVTGSAAAQVITMAFLPFITRLYGAEAFGIQGVFIAVAGTLSSVTALAYPIAIVLPERDTEARAIANLAMAIATLTSIITFVLIWFLGSSFLTLINCTEIEKYVYLIPIFMWLSALVAVLNQWFTRKQKFSLIARVTIYQSLCVNSIKAGFGFFIPSAAVLVMMNVFSGLLQAALFLARPRRKKSIQIRFLFEPNKQTLILAKKYKDFPFLRTPQIFINTISTGFPVIMLAAFFNPAIAGYYALAYSVLGVPSGIIGNSVMQVFYPKAATSHRNGEALTPLIIKTTLGMAAVGLLPFLLIVLLGPYLFGAIFGNEWSEAGIHAQWVSWWLFSSYISKPAIAAIPILGLQKEFLLYEFFSTGLKIGSLAVGYYLSFSAEHSIALFSISGSLAYAFLILWVLKSPPKHTQTRT